MKKKYLSIFMASVMVLAMAFSASALAEKPVVDADGYYQREISVSEWKSGITTQLGTNATAEFVTETVAGNTDEKLKIVHPEDTTTTITTGYISGLEDIANTNVGYYMSFLLQDFTEGSGVKMTMNRDATAVGAETSYFKNDDYTFFRKMMVYNLAKAYTSTLTVTFSGKGTLYLGDAQVEIAKILNGGFEGCAADGVPALYNTGHSLDAAHMDLWDTRERSDGYRTLNSWVKMSEDEDIPATFKTAEGKYNFDLYFFVETPTNNYIEFANAGRSEHIKYALSGVTYPVGKSYEFTVSCKTNKDGSVLAFKPNTGFDMPTPFSTYGAWSRVDTDWYDNTWTFISGGSGTAPIWRQYVTITPLCDDFSAEKLSYICIDNICVREAKERVVLYDESGNKAENLIPGQTMKAVVRKPMFTTTVADDTVTAVCGKTWAEIAVNEQKSDKSVNMIMALYVGDTILSIKNIDIKTAYGNVIAENDNLSTSLKELGFTPAKAELEFKVPKEEKATVKLFVWDDVNKLQPVGQQVYTYTTSVEAK